MSKYKIKDVSATSIHENEANPRLIKDDKFKKLVESIRTFPAMLELRPIVVNEDGEILGGNMRYKACLELGMESIPVVQVNDLTPDQQAEFIIKDNVGFGEWDWDILANSWDADLLNSWALDVPKFDTGSEDFNPAPLKNAWFLNIEFETEEEITEWYEKLTNEGLICKIVQ